MADTLFCLDISRNSVVGVLVDRNSKVIVVAGCGHAEIDEQSLSDGIADVCEQAGFTKGNCILSLSTDFFSFRNVSLPFIDQKKIAQILPLELENLSVGENENSLTDFFIAESDKNGARIVTATIDASSLATFLQLLEKRQIDPAIVEIRGVRTAIRLADSCGDTAVLLDFNGPVAGLIIISKGKIVLIRSLRFKAIPGRSSRELENLVLLIKTTLLASQRINFEEKKFTFFVTGDDYKHKQLFDKLSVQFGVEVKYFQLMQQPFIKIALQDGGEYDPYRMDPVLALALKINVSNRGFNFRKEEFKKKKSLPELRSIFIKVALPVLLFLAVAASYFVYDYTKMLDEQTMLNKQIVQVFSQAMPKTRRIVNPLQQLQVEINEVRKTYSRGEGGEHTILSLLTEISARIPQAYPVTIKRLVADYDTVRIKGVTKDFNIVDNIQKELEKSTYFQRVTISSASQSSDGDQVRFELKLELL